MHTLFSSILFHESNSVLKLLGHIQKDMLMLKLVCVFKCVQYIFRICTALAKIHGLALQATQSVLDEKSLYEIYFFVSLFVACQNES